MVKRTIRPGGRRKHRKTRVKEITRHDETDGMPEHSIAMAHDSRHWAVKVDEIDSFGSVTVYDANGRITRTISKDDLKRPWQEKVGNTWNNCLFPKRNSDKVKA